MAPTAEDLPTLTATRPHIHPVQDVLDLSLSGDDIAKDLEEIGETDEIRADSLLGMKTWLRKQALIRNCREDPSFLLRFLRFQKHQVRKSCTVLENYVLMRKKHPHWFQNLDIRDEKLADLVNSGYLFALPERDAEGRRVVFCRARILDPNRHTSSDAMRAHLLTFEALLEDEENQVKGFTYIYDCSGLSLSYLSIWSPSEARKIFTICEKNLPMRHKDINLIYLPFPMRAVLEFCKNLLSDKIKSRFCVHSSLEKLESKLGAAAPSVLPAEYGGTVPLQVMTASWAAHLEHKRTSLLGLDSIDIVEEKITRAKEERSSIWSFLPTFSNASTGSV